MLKGTIKFSVIGCCMALALAATPATARAADFEVQTVFEDALYGGAIGALVGVGFTLVSSSPSKHWDYVLTGAGVGIIAGAAYGIYTSSRSMAEIEDGKMMVGIPTPKISVQQSSEGAALALAADLVKVKF